MSISPRSLSATELRIAFRESASIRMVASDVSFRLLSGQRLALIGESGTGKTVTALVLCGLLDAHPGLVGGQVRLDEKNLYEGLDRICSVHDDDGAFRIRKNRGRFQRILRDQVRPNAHKAIGLIFQEARETLDPLRTVQAQLDEAIRGRRRSESSPTRSSESARLLGRLGFDNVAQILVSYPHELSGGMAQRVGIALALAGQPDFLIADEPTSALDAILQQQVADLILELQRKDGWGLLLITHNLRLAEYMTETIIVMFGGMIVEELPAALLSSERAALHPYTAEVRQAVSGLYGWHRSPSDTNAEEGATREAAAPVRLSESSPLSRSPSSATRACPYASRCTKKHLVARPDRDRCEESLPGFRRVGDDPRHVARCWLFGGDT